MIALKMLLMVAGVLMLAAAVAIPLYGLWLRIQFARRKTGGEEADVWRTAVGPEEIAWRGPVALAIAACLPLLVAGSIVVVPSGMGGIRISQLEGTLPGTLYPGVHFITPLIDNVEMFDLRDHLFTAGLVQEGVKSAAQRTGLDVQSREGLNIGLGVTVRYRLDPNKLASVQAHMPQPADKELVPPVVASAWRELAPAYTVREIFSTKREEVRAKGGGHHYPQAGRRRHHRRRSDALGHSTARRVRQGPGRPAAQGAGGRPARRGTPTFNRSRCGSPSCRPRPRRCRR